MLTGMIPFIARSLLPVFDRERCATRTPPPVLSTSPIPMCAGTSIPFCYVSSRFLLPMVSERHQYVHWSRWLHQRFLAPERSVPAKRQLLGRLRPVAQSGGYASVAFRASMDETVPNMGAIMLPCEMSGDAGRC